MHVQCRGMCKVELLDAGPVRNAARLVNVDSKLHSVWDQVSDNVLPIMWFMLPEAPSLVCSIR